MHTLDRVPIRCSIVGMGEVALGDETNADFIMVVKGYFDDSGDDKRKRFVSVGGLLGNKTQWDALQIPWALECYRLKGPFRSADCESQRGCCDGWTVDQTAALMRNLVKIIAATHVMGLGSIVPVPEYHRMFPGSGMHDPYFLALKHIIINMADIGRVAYAAFGFDSIQLWHEEGDTDEAAQQIYKDLKAVPGWMDAKRLEAFSIGTKRVIGLQAADLMARESFKHADNMGVRKTRKPVKALRDQTCFHLWNTECLEFLRDNGGPNNLQLLTTWSQRNDVPTMTRLYRQGFGH